MFRGGVTKGEGGYNDLKDAVSSQKPWTNNRKPIEKQKKINPKKKNITGQAQYDAVVHSEFTHNLPFRQ